MPAQGEFHGGLQKSQFVAGIIACAFETIGVDGPAAQQVAEGVGQLDFAARAGFDGQKESKILASVHSGR